MPPRPATKRTAPSVDGTELGPFTAPTTKKTRFAEPGEDEATFSEQVDASLETAPRKGRVKTEGYDSDSSDDGEGVVPSRRPGSAAQEDDDDDMFTVADKEDKKVDAGEGGGKKEDKFLRLGDIEGQEFGAEGEERDEESGDESEPEDEDDAVRKSKAGMGFELSSFNMREEMEEGKFSEDGMYVRTFDPHSLHDRWMEDVDERAIKQARKRKRQQEREQKERQRAEEQELLLLGGPHEVEKQVLAVLKKGETVLEALQRLGAQEKKKKAASQKSVLCCKTLHRRLKRRRSSKGAMDVDKPVVKGDTPVEALTHLASTLMGFGDVDIYSRTYEEIVRSVRRSDKVDDSWEPPSADVKYEYKWDVPNSTGQEGEIFGPFTEGDMQAWYKAAYFGIAGEKVKVRAVGGEWGFWDDIVPS
jgi:CD2 antigen cytoplasmic tail-binding protein 2